jgi:hypothetical protein
MPIYEIFAPKEPEQAAEVPLVEPMKDRFFSSLTTRTLFFLLLIGDIVWTAWAVAKICVLLPLCFFPSNRKRLGKAWISLKRACVCGISLTVALFSPALGIMVACTYFLMYDKSGIHEVIPHSLQDQFQEFINESK